jgi:hypothetical protein
MFHKWLNKLIIFFDGKIKARQINVCRKCMTNENDEDKRFFFTPPTLHQHLQQGLQVAVVLVEPEKKNERWVVWLVTEAATTTCPCLSKERKQKKCTTSWSCLKDVHREEEAMHSKHKQIAEEEECLPEEPEPLVTTGAALHWHVFATPYFGSPNTVWEQEILPPDASLGNDHVPEEASPYLTCLLQVQVPPSSAQLSQVSPPSPQRNLFFTQQVVARSFVLEHPERASTPRPR